MLRTISHIVFFAFLIGMSATASATATDDWKAGKQAFKNGDYQSALIYFETARDSGLSGPAVHYNIAVSQYKTGRYAAAQETFQLIANRFPKKRALAEYNMGLTAVRLGETNKARTHFRKAHELSGDDRTLQVLASRQLRELEPEVRTAANWTGAFSIRAGYDDNVALLDDLAVSAGTTTESPLAEVFASITGPWSGRNGLRVEGSAYLVKYTDAEDFDQSQLSGGLFYEWRPGNWRLQLGAQASTGAIGGDSYDRKVGPKARVVRYLSSNSSIDLRYRYDDVTEADSIYAGLAGTRQVVDARYRWYRDGHFLQLRLAAEANDRLDAGMSPDRNRLGVHYRYRPEKGLGFEAGLDLRNSEYSELATPREEDLTTLRGAVTYMFRNDWLVLAGYHNSSNDSTDPTFSYDRGQLTLGARKYF